MPSSKFSVTPSFVPSFAPSFMPDLCNRRELLAAGVAGAVSVGVAQAAATTKMLTVSSACPGSLPAASVAFAPLDPRFIGPAATSFSSHLQPVAVAPLRRVPANPAGVPVASPGAVRHVRVLGCCAAPHELLGLRVDLVQPRGAGALCPTVRRCVLAADSTGAVAPSAFTHPAASLSCIIRSPAIERLATLARPGVYAIALARRAPFWHTLRLASLPTGEGFTLALLAHDQLADVPCLLIAIH